MYCSYMTYDNYRNYVIHRIQSRSVQRANGCIEYGGDRQLHHKYGLISITIDMKRKSVPAHRALWMAINGCFDLPRNIFIRHKCDNPRCVNIDHLEPGTPKENTKDCIDRGRRAEKYKLHTRQCDHGNEKILAIKNATGKTKWIAEEFGVSISYVSKLRTGKAKTLVVNPPSD